MKYMKISKYILSASIFLYAVLSLYPFLWLFANSLKSDALFFKNMYSLPFGKIEWENYVSAWNNANFNIYYKNSILVSAISIVLIIVFVTMAGYAFAKIDFIGKKSLKALMVAVLFVPGPVLLFPVYLICRDLGILDSYIGLIGPYVCGGIPVNLLIITNAFEAIHSEISDSARIDGCNEFRIYYNIMIPLIKPAIATVFILAFMAVWNEYMWALISLTDKKLYTLQLGIVDIAAKKYIYGYGTVFAALVITSAVVVAFYMLMQKQFVKALTAGSVKG